MLGDSPIPSPHSMAEPDEPVLLYDGPGTVSVPSGHSISGALRISLDWVPTPRVSFRLACEGDIWHSPESSVTVTTDEPRDLSGLVGQHMVTSGGDKEFRTELRGVCWGEHRLSHEGLDHVVFNVANLPGIIGSSLVDESEGRKSAWSGRNVYEGDRWKLTLDRLRLPEASTGEWLRGAGYGITHVAMLERRDGMSTSVEEVGSALSATSQFLSFVRGEPAPALLPKGIGIGGDVVWEEWASPTTTPWRGSQSPFPDFVSEEAQVRPPRLEPVFGFFSDRWADPAWAELLRFGVGWYLTANANASVETKIILSQVGLELASWTAFVPARLSKDGFNRLPAHDYLRLLLSEADLATDIPGDFMRNLEDFAAANNWNDGPRAVTELRNLFVHPTKAMRARDVPSEVMIEASDLALGYLQAALLFILQYDDQYVPAVGFAGPRAVPWSLPLTVPPLPIPGSFPPLPHC